MLVDDWRHMITFPPCARQNAIKYFLQKWIEIKKFVCVCVCLHVTWAGTDSLFVCQIEFTAKTLFGRSLQLIVSADNGVRGNLLCLEFRPSANCSVSDRCRKRNRSNCMSPREHTHTQSTQEIGHLLFSVLHFGTRTHAHNYTKPSIALDIDRFENSQIKCTPELFFASLRSLYDKKYTARMPFLFTRMNYVWLLSGTNTHFKFPIKYFVHDGRTHAYTQNPHTHKTQAKIYFAVCFSLSPHSQRKFTLNSKQNWNIENFSRNSVGLWRMANG